MQDLRHYLMDFMMLMELVLGKVRGLCIQL